MDIESALKILNKDAKMQKLIDNYGLPDFKPSNNYFESLMRSIVFQQLNGKVANIIYQRLINLVPINEIIPQEVLILKDENMSEIGLSKQKISYIKNLANYFNTNLFSSSQVKIMSNERIRTELLQIKGIGQWTVDMFLMFTLNRPDIIPYTDLGIRKSIKNLFKLDSLPTKNEIESLSIQWKPYRTIACWYLWKNIDNDSK